MKDARPQLPSGNSPRMFFARCVWWYLWGGRANFADSDTVKIEFTNGYYSFKAKPTRGAVGGAWDWMYPDHKELDPSLPYSKGKWVYISALNSLVTTGMTDIVSNVNATSCIGLWECCQDVPAAVGGKFNVPVWPYPAGAATIGGSTFLQGTTAPSGTPLIGDLDLVNPTTGKKILYWIYRGDI